MHSHIEFGYPWWLTYGHLVITAIVLPLWLLGWARKWSKLLLAVIGAVAVWSLAAFLVARFGLDVNGRTGMPTQSFLSSGSGRVLDMGAGSGRSSLMVLEARPKTTLVALDSFSTEYTRHFGTDGTREVLDVGRERLLANFRAAGVEQRATIQPGDMRKMPFEAATFDGIVSAYAIDHLGREGIVNAMSEASRVLKPGGEFLLMVIAKDFCVNFAWGPVFMHGGVRGPARWEKYLRDAGFEIVEEGTRPATLYFLARKR
jgi:SAM-dependent methyltransferase